MSTILSHLCIENSKELSVAQDNIIEQSIEINQLKDNNKELMKEISRLNGDMEVLKDFNIQQEAGKYIKEHSILSIYDFLSNLEEAGLVKKYEVKTFYIGSMSYDGNDFDWFENFSNEEVENNINKWLNDEEDEEDEE